VADVAGFEVAAGERDAVAAVGGDDERAALAVGLRGSGNPAGPTAA
jgi:hypothetical protein